MVVLTATLAAGGTQTATIAIPSSVGLGNSAPILRFLVVQTAGSATSYTATFSTDAAVSDLLKRIAALTGGAAATPIDTLGTYPWEGGANVYCKVTPNAGSDNAYTIKVFLGGSNHPLISSDARGINSVVADVDALKALVGAAADATSAATVFGRLNAIKAKTDTL